jgi:hypothetical protein
MKERLPVMLFFVPIKEMLASAIFLGEFSQKVFSRTFRLTRTTKFAFLWLTPMGTSFICGIRIL